MPHCKNQSFMKYAIRAIKYFLYLTVVFGVVIWVLACFTSKSLIYKPEDFAGTLVHGWNSVWMILGIFALVACIYPMLGYMKRPLMAGGSIDELRASLDDFMESRGYVFEKQYNDSVCYRLGSGAGRASRSWEDRISIFQSASGLVMEGLRKDVTRLASGLETRLGSNEE